MKLRVVEAPTPEDALVVARALRVEGDMRARSLAEEMERACRPAVLNSERNIVAARRAPEPQSYVAGAIPLNRTKRYSGDIDVFPDQQERLSAADVAELKTLQAAGYKVVAATVSRPLHIRSCDGGGQNR